MCMDNDNSRQQHGNTWHIVEQIVSMITYIYQCVNTKSFPKFQLNMCFLFHILFKWKKWKSILEIFLKVYTCIIVEHKMNHFKLKTLNKSKEHIINHICLYLICRLVIIYSINTHLGNNFPQFINISNIIC